MIAIGLWNMVLKSWECFDKCHFWVFRRLELAPWSSAPSTSNGACGKVRTCRLGGSEFQWPIFRMVFQWVFASYHKLSFLFVQAPTISTSETYSNKSPRNRGRQMRSGVSVWGGPAGLKTITTLALAAACWGSSRVSWLREEWATPS